MTQISKKEARVALGIRDEHLRTIPLEKRNREALLDTVALMSVHAEAKASSARKMEETLMTKIKDLRKAKREANSRADKAEAKLREIIKTVESE